ncbi:DUF748 domain-containing protein [Paraglaciecola hydrolytica]|uniref:DUF748 domain-containing protein n=1 Tax=Paraglaciecola hydrolytica TaxID=1799789 RepID=UPI0009E8873A|nr:DUF748 domain-containing protein [Paraglaciecola hydrolytica]
MQLFYRKSALTLFFIILLLVLLRVAAPYAVKKGVNYAIDTTPGLSGKVGDIDIALYRGAYQIEDIELYLVDGELQKPLIKIQQLDISVLWSALFHGSIVSKMTFLQPQFYYADKAEREEHINEDVQNEQTWITLANRLVPFSIDRIDIVAGRLLFAVINNEQTNITEIQEINGHITNLTNSKKHSGSLVTNMRLDAVIENVSPIVLSGSYDPYADKPSFNFDVEMQRLPVKKIDHLISFYTPFDVEAGEVDFVMEFAANQGVVEGYVKGGVYDLSVFDWQEDVVKDGDNPFQLLFEALTGGVAELFENGQSDLLGTKVPLEGTIDELKTPLWPAIFGIIKNAFFKALEIKIDDIVKIDATQCEVFEGEINPHLSALFNLKMGQKPC